MTTNQLIMPCAEVIPCAKSTGPLIGYNSETPDVLQFLGNGFGPADPPPLGWSVSAGSMYASANSLISQADADAQAYAASIASWQSLLVAPNNAPPVPLPTLDGFPDVVEEFIPVPPII